MEETWQAAGEDLHKKTLINKQIRGEKERKSENLIYGHKLHETTKETKNKQPKV